MSFVKSGIICILIIKTIITIVVVIVISYTFRDIGDEELPIPRQLQQLIH